MTGEFKILDVHAHPLHLTHVLINLAHPKSLKFYRDYLGLSVIQDFWDDSNYINKITGINNANVHMIKLKADDGSVPAASDCVS